MTSTCIDARSDEEHLASFHARVLEQRVPISGSLELTRRCNLQCVHCYLGDQKSIRRHRREEMDTAQIKGILDELVAAGTLELTLTGGDPMVRPDFPEIYEYAVRSGLLVTIFCDGVLISDRIAALFDRLPPRKVEISIYGATEATYEAVTQVRGSFRKCLAGIERLREHGHRFAMKTVLLTLNEHELPAMRAMAEDYGVSFYFDAAVFPCLPHDDNGAGSNRRAPAPAAPVSVEVAAPTRPAPRPAPARGGLQAPLDLRVDAERVAALEAGDPKKLEELAGLYLRTREMPASEFLYTCGAGLTTFHIDPYGNLQPCTISTNVKHNVLDDGFRAGWDGPVAAIRDIRARAEHTCQSCELRSLCSGCPAMFSAETGRGDVKSDWVCALTHRVFEEVRPAVRALELEQSGSQAT